MPYSASIMLTSKIAHSARNSADRINPLHYLLFFIFSELIHFISELIHFKPETFPGNDVGSLCVSIPFLWLFNQLLATSIFCWYIRSICNHFKLLCVLQCVENKFTTFLTLFVLFADFLELIFKCEGIWLLQCGFDIKV